MRRTVLAGVVLIAATFALACEPATSPLDLAGNYTLTTVNGLALPYVFPQVGPTKVEVLDDTYTLNPGGTFAETGHKRFTTDGSVAIAFPIDAGNFTRRGDTITLESLVFGARTGTIRNGVFSLVIEGLSLVYQK